MLRNFFDERENCMRIFSVDKLVFNGIHAYRLGEYQKADNLLNGALELDRINFAANIWKVRTLVMLGEYVEAIHIIDTHPKKKLNTKLSDLFLKWKEFCLIKVQLNADESEDISQMNRETDELMEQYQHQRDFTLWDIIVALGMFFVIVLLVIQFRVFNEVRFSVVSLIYTVMMAYYYYAKSILPMNIYDIGSYIFQKIIQLYHSFLFKNIVIYLFLIDAFLNLKSHENHLVEQITGSIILTVVSMFIDPINEEIFMRGFLYGYLKRYNKWFAWIIVTIAFYAMHTVDANWWHIMLSCVCLYVYDHEKTILAPIVLHVLNNTFGVALYIWVMSIM